MLWGRSGNRCAFPDCRKELVIDETNTDDASIIGEEAHIVARKLDGPRGKSSLTYEKRDKYDNLILLCSIDHKLIDDQENNYSIDTIKQYKILHETWVRENLQHDDRQQRDDEIYASYVDKLILLAKVDNWKGWTSSIFEGGQPRMLKSDLTNLKSLIEYIMSRVWPKRYPDIEKAFYNFKNVANDFVNVFNKYMEDDSDECQTNNEKDVDYPITLWTKKIYQIDTWDTELYNRLLSKYEYHCFLVEDLALEMTRAINHLFDTIRYHLFSGFRMNEGVLLIEIGPFQDFSYKIVRVEYDIIEKDSLYPGLREFMDVRGDRTYSRGIGVSNDYFSKPYY